MLVHQGSPFGQSDRSLFIHFALISNVSVDKTEIAAHSSLDVGDRSHQQLRQTFRKIMSSHSSTDPKILLAFAVKAMNDTMGSECLVPSALVPSALFSLRFPSIATPSEPVSTGMSFEDRADVIQLAKDKMRQLMAKIRVIRALKLAILFVLKTR